MREEWRPIPEHPGYEASNTGRIRSTPRMDAVRKGFDSGSISRCCTGKIAHHKGHHWAFYERNAA